MLVSYKWLQTYFDAPLPALDELTDLLTMGVFEIDGVEKKGDDAVIDVKVLPDRAAYGYSHRYIAAEIAALVNKPLVLPSIAAFTEGNASRTLDVSIIMKHDADVALCKRYIGRVIEGVRVEASPVWLKDMLETLGQRSINSIVDLTNYVMLECGQPLHAFDADKVEGDIVVRAAKEGEKLVILDGTEISLLPSMLVIADSAGPLALAGIKGGKRAEITGDTKNIILESACFDSSSTRKTAQVVGIRNESSKRFENGVTAERAGLAMAMITSKIAELNPAAVIGHAVDVYPDPVSERDIQVSVGAINTRLGLSLSGSDMASVLLRLGIISSVHEEDADILNVAVPPHRPDLNIVEDIAEEIGRINGYDKLGEIIPESKPDRSVSKNFYYFNLIRRLLAEIGFSEVYTYSLIEKGDMAVINPLTVERAFMRNTISELLSQKFLFNLRNLDLLGLKDVRLFEIGKVFGQKRERNSLAFGVGQMKLSRGQDPKAEAVAIASHVFHHLGASDSVLQSIASRLTLTELTGDAHIPCVGLVAELDIDDIIDSLPQPSKDVDLGHLLDSVANGTKFRAISTYPFSSRDVAVFVPGEAGREAEVLQVMQEALKAEPCGSGTALDLLARSTLFDVFTKNREGEPVRTSYAYRLVFQAADRTLTEEEVSAAMKAIFAALGAKEGWEVR